MARSGTGTALVSADVGDGGLRADVERLVLRDGSSVVIGLLETADEAGITSWFTSCFAGLGAEMLYARLFVLLEWLDRFATSAVAAVDRLGLEPVAAFAPDGVTVGIARCLPVTARPRAPRSRLRWPRRGRVGGSRPHYWNGSRPERGLSTSSN